MQPLNDTTIKQAIAQFPFANAFESYAPFGNGHINDTYRVMLRAGQYADASVLLQRLNTDVFHDPVGVLNNIVNVTSWLRRNIIVEDGDPARETLTVIETSDGKRFYTDPDGNFFRALRFIDHAEALDLPRTTNDFYESALVFGRFQKMLSNFPAETLAITIESFHDEEKRLETFRQVVRDDVCGRVKDAGPEIDAVLAHAYLATIYKDKASGRLIPLRVTHNDTKLNNVMMDISTGKGLCVTDLDTVMPGYIMNDFGDAIRTGASTAAEDETDLQKVSCDLNMVDIFAKGFLSTCSETLTDVEKELMAYGALVMTFETGMRFLTDYLQGDIYYHIHRERHNLERSGNQLCLLADMEAKLPRMQEIIARYY